MTNCRPTLACGSAQAKSPQGETLRALSLQNPGDDLLSRLTHYHGPRVLNGRVRDGNGCGHTGMVAGNINRQR